MSGSWSESGASGDSDLGAALGSGADVDPSVGAEAARSDGGGEETVAAPESVGGRLAGSVVAILFGFVLVALACAGLFWNEGHAVKVAKALDEVKGAVRPVSSDKVDPANDGAPIHLAGPTTSAKGVEDAAYGVRVRGLKLARSVEMYQWQERESGSGQDRKYTYSRVWSGFPINSSHFHASSGHQNPSFPLRDRDVGAADATLGAVPVGAQAALKLPAKEEVPLDAAGAAAAQKSLGRPVQVSGGAYYVGQTPDAPHIGDLRIRYQVAPEMPASFIGRQEPGGLEPYRAKNGQEILLGYAGTHAAEAVVQMGHHDNAVTTWILRGVGLVVMLIGFVLFFAPVNVLASYVPILGNFVSGALFVVALVATLVFGPVVIALAWFVYRPLLAGGAILLAILAGVAFRQWRMRRLRMRPAAAAPFVPPPRSAARVY